MHVCICIYAALKFCTYNICIYIYVYYVLSMYICICMCVCVCVCIYIYTLLRSSARILCIYIHTHTRCLAPVEACLARCPQLRKTLGAGTPS